MTRNLTATLVDELRARIVDGSFAPGEKLPSENTLIAEHGVSRTVVREAITRLQAEGLVHTRRGAGSFALIPPAAAEGGATAARAAKTLDERRHLLAFRAAIESEAAALAAGRRTGGQLALLDAALAAFDAAGDNPASAMSCDFDFHRSVAEASGNPYIIDAITGFGPAMIAMPPHRLDAAAGGRLPAESRLARVAAEHRSIRDAIEAGDGLAAAAAMRTHLANSRRRLDGRSGEA
jgi:GntR family transcriptional regulator, transcriptional repressor for pyruvate dehydrogenase complex